MARILYADDDASLRAALKIILTAAGYECRGACDGGEAVEQVDAFEPDLLILDVMMPGLNGFEVCERLRAAGRMTPVLFLSAKGEAQDRKAGLRSGADDYVAKPFDPEELLLRIEALLRRAGAVGRPGPSRDSLRVGDLELDLRRRECRRGGEAVRLTPKEFSLLAYLAEHAGEPVAQDELTEAVWGEDYAGETTGVAVYVRRIRGKLEPDPSHPAYLKTVWGVGYKLDAPQA